MPIIRSINLKGHDIKDCTIYKLAQDYFNSNRKDPNSYNQEALLALLTVYKKAYTAKKSLLEIDIQCPA